MKLICKIIGHNLIDYFSFIEKNYEGYHRDESNRKPHTLHENKFLCKRCAYQFTVSNYFFDHEKETK